MFLIIGGTSEIAYQISKILINHDDVIVTYRNKNKLQQIKGNNKNKIFYKKLDINNLNEIKKFVLQNQRLLKNINFVNLATTTADGLVHNLKLNNLHNVYNVNVFSNIIFSKELLPLMIRQNYGRFIFFTSTRGERGDKGISLYSSSKQSLNGFSRCLSKEYSSYNITSNCIKLGYFNTKLFNNIPVKIKKKLKAEIPSNKLGDINNITVAIQMIVKANYISGSTITIDGSI